MNIALWIVAGLLAVAFLASGAMKLAAFGMGWVEDFGAGAVKAIGALEVLAAVGLILPAALGIAPVLVPLAAVGLVVLMAGAIITHLRRHEAQVIASPVALLALAVLVAWGRFGPSPSPADPRPPGVARRPWPAPRRTATRTFTSTRGGSNVSNP
jgi:uncharacterized membrane protein YphA (DoxX/SURF4 family)